MGQGEPMLTALFLSVAIELPWRYTILCLASHLENINVGRKATRDIQTDSKSLVDRSPYGDGGGAGAMVSKLLLVSESVCCSLCHWFSECLFVP